MKFFDTFGEPLAEEDVDLIQQMKWTAEKHHAAAMHHLFNAGSVNGADVMSAVDWERVAKGDREMQFWVSAQLDTMRSSAIAAAQVHATLAVYLGGVDS